MHHFCASAENSYELQIKPVFVREKCDLIICSATFHIIMVTDSRSRTSFLMPYEIRSHLYYFL